MKHSHSKSVTLTLTLVLLLLMTLCISMNDARGGRGRGGSFGGIFGGWRKYKKTSSSTNSRRTVNGSPMQTEMQKPIAGAGNTGRTNFGASMPGGKPQTANYPKQQIPHGIGNSANSGYHGYSGGYHSNGAAAGAALPPGSAYYANTAAMPTGAIYYAQPPMRSGTGDFLFGMMAGHMMSNMIFPRHHQVTHVYEQRPAQQSANSGSKVVIVENGGNQTQQNYWPTDSNVPLAPFNETVTPEYALQAHNDSHFKGPPPATMSEQRSVESSDHTQKQPQSAVDASGVICVPVMFNETDPTDVTKTKMIEKTICFPAPITTPKPDVVPAIRTLATVNTFDSITMVTAEPVEIAGDISVTDAILKSKQLKQSLEDSKEV